MIKQLKIRNTVIATGLALAIGATALIVPASTAEESAPTTQQVAVDYDTALATLDEIRADAASRSSVREFPRPEAAAVAIDDIVVPDDSDAAIEAAEALTADAWTAFLGAKKMATEHARELYVGQIIIEELIARSAGDTLEVSDEDVDTRAAEGADSAIEAARALVGTDADDTVLLTAAIAFQGAKLQALLDITDEVVRIAEEERAARDAIARPIIREQAEAAQADAERLSEYADSVAGFENGEIPEEALCSIATYDYHKLRCDAAAQFDRLNIAFRAQFGVDIEVTDSYRSLEQQITAKEEKPTLAAKPGTSNHGWGIAVDVGNNIGWDQTTEQHEWFYANAPMFGWTNPDWARPGGQKDEPWHWEFNANYADIDSVMAE